MLLNLKNCLHNGNCMLDYDVPLMQGNILQEKSVALNASLLYNKEKTDDDSIDDDIEMDKIEKLPTSILESCALEYFAGYTTKKYIDKSQCRTC